MAQFVVFYTRYWSGTASQTPAPSGAYTAALTPCPGPGEQWQIINEYAALADAYTAADAAATTYLVEIYDRDNQAKLYINSPAVSQTLATITAGNWVPDGSFKSLTTKMDNPTYLAWERVQIQNEIWAQVVQTTNGAGVRLGIYGQPVLTGFYALPANTAAWVAILEVATVRTRTSGQTAQTVAALMESWG
jgi:hypothetical protein